MVDLLFFSFRKGRIFCFRCCLLYLYICIFFISWSFNKYQNYIIKISKVGRKKTLKKTQILNSQLNVQSIKGGCDRHNSSLVAANEARVSPECILYTVHCTLYTVLCTLYIVHCTLYTVATVQYCTIYNEHWTPTTVQGTGADANHSQKSCFT